MKSPTPIANSSSRTDSGSVGCHLTARSWKSSSWRTIRGSSACSSIQSCAPGPRVRIRCSPDLLPPPPLPSGARRQPPRVRRWSRPPTSMVGGFPRDALFLIAGPCVLEDDTLNLRVGEALARLADSIPGGIVYKASFDKANRSNASAHRGPGMHEGLEKLARVRAKTGLRVRTDVHLPEQCEAVAQVVDVLQIPAFLCRQTDLLEAAGATGKAVNVKKAQWLHPEGMRGAVDKVAGARVAAADNSPEGMAGSAIAVTERGSFF